MRKGREKEGELRSSSESPVKSTTTPSVLLAATALTLQEEPTSILRFTFFG